MILRPTDWTDDAARALIERAMDHDTSAGMLRPEQTGGVPFRIEEDDGRLIGAYVLDVNHWPGGREGVVAYAGAVPGRRDLVAELLPTIERQFLDCKAVTIHTRRRGLVRKLERQGYAIEGYILRKRTGA